MTRDELKAIVDSRDPVVMRRLYDHIVPRLVTVEDFDDNPDVDQDGYLPAWCETTQSYDEATGALMGLEGCTFSGWGTIERSDLTCDEDFGKGLRYWTARPSVEQMMETPWENGGDQK